MSRCFPLSKVGISSSGERTKSKKQSVKYLTTLANKTSDNYKNYDTNYKLDGDCLKSAQSYEDLLDITKGKYYSNPQLNGATATKMESWAGNFISVDLSGCGFAPITDLSWNGTNIILNENNMMPFTLPQFVSGTWGGSDRYPGYIVDASSAFTYHICNKNNDKSVLIEKYGKINYRYTQDYWNAVDGDRLNGINYPTKINFNIQETDMTNENALIYAPQASYKNNNSTDQLERWCSNKY